MTRTGKIARLSHEIREQLNHRLRDGEQGKALVAWLNSLPEVQTVLAADFAGQPINPQNLSEWKRGGYRDWHLQQEALAMVQTLSADTDALKAASPEPLVDKLALWLVARYAVAAKSLKGVADWQRLRELCADVVALQKGDHSAARLKLERERLELDRELAVPDLDNLCPAWAADPANRDKLPRPRLTQEEYRARMREIFGMPPAPPSAGVDTNSSETSRQPVRPGLSKETLGKIEETAQIL
jgi:hypothetical protein